MPPLCSQIPDATGLRGPNAVTGVFALLLLGVAPVIAAAEDLEAARQQFLTSCGTCHAVEKDAPLRQGPNLLGVIGRKSGKLDGFKYSDALAKSEFTWDEATLDRWIEDTQVVVPGNVMSYRQANSDKRQLVIAYLRSLSH